MTRRGKRAWVIGTAVVLMLAGMFFWWLVSRGAEAEPSGNARFVSGTMREEEILC